MEQQQRIDFSRSRVCWNHGSTKSNGSFKVESVVRIYTADNREETLFALGSGVLAGNMYVREGLVKTPSYLFQLAVSNEHHVIFRTYTCTSTITWKSVLRRIFTSTGKSTEEADTSGENKRFESLSVHLSHENSIRIGEYEEIQHHYLRHADFTALIKIPLAENRRLELEFPVKHFNILPDRGMFQIETGPVLFIEPEMLDTNPGYLLKVLVPSFIHFNRFDCADFSLDFPYGVRKTPKRGRMKVETMNCDIRLLVDYSD